MPFFLPIMDAPDDEGIIRQRLIQSIQKWGHRYPGAGYGLRFSDWLDSENPQPYNSWCNGSAMRVSSVAWLYDDLDTVRRMARLSAEVTHNHPEGIKGAEATASAIFLARTGSSKAEIKAYVEKQFGYDLSRTCDEIRLDYHHVGSCQETVPEAITAFLEGESFENVIRTSVSLGGDCDTLTCINRQVNHGSRHRDRRLFFIRILWFQDCLLCHNSDSQHRCLPDIRCFSFRKCPWKSHRHSSRASFPSAYRKGLPCR